MKRAAKRKIPRKNSTAPVTLPVTTWDMGAMGAANRIGLVMEDAGDIDPDTGQIVNPNSIKRMRRVDMLEHWHGNYIKPKPNGQWITTPQYTAAEALRDAFERTQMGPGIDLSQERVDSSPKPDHAVTIAIDRISRFHKVNKLVPSTDRAIIDACVLMGATPAYVRHLGRRPYFGPNYGLGMEVLRAALDRLAKAMGA